MTRRVRDKKSEPPVEKFEEAKTSEEVQSLTPASQPQDFLAEDLMRRVTRAIEEWSQANRLENVPLDIILQQVISILKAGYQLEVGRRDSRITKYQ
jgi:hypothetical protein